MVFAVVLLHKENVYRFPTVAVKVAYRPVAVKVNVCSVVPPHGSPFQLFA